MRHYLKNLCLVLGTVLLLATMAVTANDVPFNYPSGPGGVVLEGTAAGMESPAMLAFDGKSNCFTLDGAMLYRNPVSWAEWLEILSAIDKDERLGVSLTMNMRLITYGGLSQRSRIAKNLEMADRFLAGVCFGVPRLMGKASLPGEYRPVRVPKLNLVIACYNITNFIFEKEQQEYKRNSCEMQIFLLAVNKEKAPDGGHLLDNEATKDLEKKVDCTNINHVRDNQTEYLKIPVLAKAVAVGEAAAFARFLRNNGFNLTSMHAAMSVRNPVGAIKSTTAIVDDKKMSSVTEETGASKTNSSTQEESSVVLNRP